MAVHEGRKGEIYVTRNQKHAVLVTEDGDGIRGKFIERECYTLPELVPMYPGGEKGFGQHDPECIYAWHPGGAFQKGHEHDVDLVIKLREAHS
jgi:hypothetical protein